MEKIRVVLVIVLAVSIARVIAVVEDSLNKIIKSLGMTTGFTVLYIYIMI